MFDTDPNRSTDDILNDIRNSALIGANQKNLSLVVSPLAALLVRLSKEASDTADKNLSIQATTLRITKWVLAVAIIALALSIIQIAKDYMRDPEGPTKTNEGSKQQSKLQPVK